MAVDDKDMDRFRKTVWDYYASHGRTALPWRQPEADGPFDPYKILVSELMLQQTQVGRVEPKYRDFLQRFPDVIVLAGAPLADVLTAWQGLGYNRRARYLWLAARQVTEQGSFPDDMNGLVALPGVGPNTAGAIMAYAYDEPVVFIETNIRTVFIHHFAPGQTDVPDSLIRDLVSRSLPGGPGAREWYWALMDYGTHLKQTVGNVSRQSRLYNRQSTFAGSRRQIRGQVLKLLAAGPATRETLRATVPDERLDSVLDDLGREQLIGTKGDSFMLYQG